jgi:hypothetical protein
VKAAAETEYMFYLWLDKALQNPVPVYATAIEGVVCLLLSPDEKKFLTVWERGCWSMVGGAVKCIARQTEPRELHPVALLAAPR